MVWTCSGFELVTSLTGPQTFKIGDEAWSADADFGVGSDADASHRQLSVKGKELTYTFTGTHRINLDMSRSTVSPTLQITTCPDSRESTPKIFLRGSMNNWSTQDDYAFQYSCDAYYLNVNLRGRHEFKIADAVWSNDLTLGGPGVPPTMARGEITPLSRTNVPAVVANLAFEFAGEHTLRLAFPGGQPMLSIGELSFADPNAEPIRNMVALSLKHDSRELSDKSPFGAVTAGTSVDFSIQAAAGVSAVTLVIEKRRLEGNQDVLDYSPVSRVDLTVEPAGGNVRWSGKHSFNDIGVYGYYFEALIGGETFIYQNNRDVIHWTREKGSNGLGRVEAPGQLGSSIRRNRLTVYQTDFTVPAWARDVIYYYIFPERFRNGNRGNDARPGLEKYHGGSVELHGNWTERPYKPGTGDGSDSIYNNDFFGGDIAGIIEKLDYISDLGANALYITPLFTASSNHKYDTADYRSIDPHFGSNEDFSRLAVEAGKRGIRVIADTSLNHTGSDSLYFDRFGNFGGQGAFAGGRIKPDSPYADWYSFDATQADPDKKYKGWTGVVDLPELNKASAGFREFAYGADDSVMKQWLDRGAAGWRMDVAPWVPDDFWREWRTAIKQHRPDALTIAETWFDSSKYFLGDMFDSTMNYIFRNTILDYAAGGDARRGYHNIEFIREAYPPQAFGALMNLLSTHDAPRALHVFGYQDEQTDPAKVTEAKQRLRLAIFFQMIFPGAPTIFYGDEVGLTGGEDPFNRGTYPWADQGGLPDETLLRDVKALAHMRRDNPVLRHGSLDAPVLLDENLIVLIRRDADSAAITATNNSSVGKRVELRLPMEMRGMRFRDALTRTELSAEEDGRLVFSVPALFGTVLISR